MAISFTYLFGLESTWAHRLMVVTLAAVIGLVLSTVGALEYPFSGGARIGTGAFDLILERFETSELKNPRKGLLRSLLAGVRGRFIRRTSTLRRSPMVACGTCL